jgi:cytochrome c oxidase cbb3-type subunit III
MENNENHGTIHVYDGIEEENNPMPLWWVALFIGCCIFAGIYWLHYTTGGGQTLQQEYAENFNSYQAQFNQGSTDSDDSEESLTQFMKSELALSQGAGLFAAKCAMCHGEKLEGKIGPNLTDAFWSTGDGSRMAIVHTIKTGSAAKGMPPWLGLLKPDEIKSVAAFVFSKIGSNPPNPKAPEGTEIKK